MPKSVEKTYLKLPEKMWNSCLKGYSSSVGLLSWIPIRHACKEDKVTTDEENTLLAIRPKRAPVMPLKFDVMEHRSLVHNVRALARHDHVHPCSEHLLTGKSCNHMYWLVVWNIFPYIGNNNPNWLIFFGRLKPPTRSVCLVNITYAFYPCSKHLHDSTALVSWNTPLKLYISLWSNNSYVSIYNIFTYTRVIIHIHIHVHIHIYIYDIDQIG